MLTSPTFTELNAASCHIHVGKDLNDIPDQPFVEAGQRTFKAALAVKKCPGRHDDRGRLQIRNTIRIQRSTFRE